MDYMSPGGGGGGGEYVGPVPPSSPPLLPSPSMLAEKVPHTHTARVYHLTNMIIQGSMGLPHNSRCPLSRPVLNYDKWPVMVVGLQQQLQKKPCVIHVSTLVSHIVSTRAMH